MADPRVVALLRRREILEEGIALLLPRLRVFFVVGGFLVIAASVAMTSVLVTRSVALAPVGILMALAGLFEAGVGHIARGGGPRGNPWQTAGALHIVAGLVTIFGGGVLPGWIHVTLIGASVLGAGVTWLRMGFAMPEKYQSGVIPLSAGVTCVVGLLLIMRWGAGDPLLVGLMLSGEMLVRGWAWIALGMVIGKRAGQ